MLELLTVFVCCTCTTAAAAAAAAAAARVWCTDARCCCGQEGEAGNEFLGTLLKQGRSSIDLDLTIGCAIFGLACEIRSRTSMGGDHAEPLGI